MQLFHRCILAIGLVAIISYASADGIPNPTVTIGSGVVIGTATGVFSAPSSTATVYNYLGIPYAAPPTGSLRFAPPAEPTAWSSPLVATSFAPACLQQFSDPKFFADFNRRVYNNPGGLPPPESEDCLYLNVFAPLDASPTQKKAVLFWISGGNLVFGSASMLYYDGSSFAGYQDVVVVTINYRTNIFGFSGSPEIPRGLQNSGFLDQRFALQWVQNNIAQFGGDPTKVTIFGESSGGYSVKQLLAQPPSPLPFRAAILQSEQASINGPLATGYQQTLIHFDCATAPSPIECLRNIPAEDILAYISQNASSFSPVNDHVTQSNDVRSSITSRPRQFANVPILIGTNADEGRVFAAALGIDNSNTTIQQVVAKILPKDIISQLLLFGAYASLRNDVYLFASAIITDFAFTCHTAALSSFAASNGYHVWRYYYNASFPNLNYFPNAGSYHSSEIPQVFGTYPLINQYGTVTPEQEQLSRYMQTTWVNFAKSPEQGPGWARLGTNFGKELGEIGGRDAVGETTIPLLNVDHVCGIYGSVFLVQGF